MQFSKKLTLFPTRFGKIGIFGVKMVLECYHVLEVFFQLLNRLLNIGMSQSFHILLWLPQSSQYLRRCFKSCLIVAWASCPCVAGPFWPCNLSLFTGETPVELTGRMPVLLLKHPLRAILYNITFTRQGICVILLLAAFRRDSVILGR